MRHIVICGLSGFLQYFSILFYKLNDFSEKILLNIKCFDFLYNIFLKRVSF